jgi:hypothetical protein
MSDTSIIISATAFRSFSQATKAEILGRLGVYEPQSLPSSGDAENGPADLSTAQARKLISGTGERTTIALRAIARNGPRFRSTHVAEALGDTDLGTLRGVWAAITRRTRTVLSDPQADLIWWEEEGISDDKGEYVDHEGRISAMTFRSLRLAFGLED